MLAAAASTMPQVSVLRLQPLARVPLSSLVDPAFCGTQCSQSPVQCRKRNDPQIRSGLALNSAFLGECSIKTYPVPCTLRRAQEEIGELLGNASRLSSRRQPGNRLCVNAKRQGLLLGRQNFPRGPRKKRGTTTVDHSASKSMPLVPKLEADPSETEHIVHSVLESFHEDTEPWFFREYRDPPLSKPVDPLLVTSGGQNSGEVQLSSMQGNRRLVEVLSGLEHPTRRDVGLLMLMGAAESHVAAAMALEAERKPRTAPSDVSLFRAFSMSEPDIYYPKFFEGYWEVDSVLVDVDIPGGIQSLSYKQVASIRNDLDRHEKWEVRFFNHRGKIIADRVYNTLSLASGRPQKFRVIWDPDDPGKVRMEMAVDKTGQPTNSGLGIEALVTKRSFDSSQPGVFEASEFMRELSDNLKVVDGPPGIGAKQVVTRYKWDSAEEFPNELKVIQKVATFDLASESDGFGKDVETLLRMLSQTRRPSIVKKYTARMTRKTKPAT